MSEFHSCHRSQDDAEFSICGKKLSELNSKVECKAAMKMEELSTVYLFKASKISELYFQPVRPCQSLRGQRNPSLPRLRYNIYSCVQGRWGQDASDFSKLVFGSKIHLGKKKPTALQGHKASLRAVFTC